MRQAVRRQRGASTLTGRRWHRRISCKGDDERLIFCGGASPLPHLPDALTRATRLPRKTLGQVALRSRGRALLRSRAQGTQAFPDPRPLRRLVQLAFPVGAAQHEASGRSAREPRDESRDLAQRQSQEPNRASERVGSLRAKPSDQYAEGLRPCRTSPTRSLAQLGSREKRSANLRSVRAGGLRFARPLSTFQAGRSFSRRRWSCRRWAGSRRGVRPRN